MGPKGECWPLITNKHLECSLHPGEQHLPLGREVLEEACEVRRDCGNAGAEYKKAGRWRLNVSGMFPGGQG